jgi:hypothetical protein
MLSTMELGTTLASGTMNIMQCWLATTERTSLEAAKSSSQPRQAATTLHKQTDY